MAKLSYLPKLLIVFTSILFVYFIATGNRTGSPAFVLSILFGIIIHHLLKDGRKGDRATVRKVLLQYTVILALFLVLAFIVLYK